MGFKFYNIFNLKKKWQVDLVNTVFSLIITVSLICLTYFLKIPNPNLILFTGLIVLTSLFGFVPGSVALLGVWFYSLFFFSDYTFIKFTEQNAIKTVVSFITSVLCYFFVGGLNLLYKRDATKIIAANKLLMESNERLEEISSIDSLTKTKNRYSLRKDFETYLHQEVYVMIFDIDEFKNINDKHGHIMGDKILMSVGEATQKIFSSENSYRYGGDDFVIIQKETTLVVLKHQIKKRIVVKKQRKNNNVLLLIKR